MVGLVAIKLWKIVKQMSSKLDYSFCCNQVGNWL